MIKSKLLPLNVDSSFDFKLENRGSVTRSVTRSVI